MWLHRCSDAWIKMGPKVYLVDHDNLCAGPWQPRFLAPLWTAQTQSVLNLQKVLVNSANLHEFWFICRYFQILMVGEKVRSLHCLEVWRSKECPSSTVTLSLDLSLPCNLRELMQGLHLPSILASPGERVIYGLAGRAEEWVERECGERAH